MATEALDGASTAQLETAEQERPSQHPDTSTADVKPSLATLSKDPPMRSLLEHPSTRDVRKSLGTDFTELSDTVLRLSEPFDAVHLKCAEKTATFSMAEMFHLLYSYIINRAAAIISVEGDGYIIHGFYESKTDAAFIQFVSKLVDKPHEEESIPGTAGRAIILDDRTTKAGMVLNIFTNRSLEFRAQMQVEGMLRPEDVALFWFTKSAERAGAWDSKSEFVSRSYAVCFHGDDGYQF